MNQYNEISTLQYMGSKTRIISHICEPIIKNKSIKTVVDLFAGTGSVGYALKAHKNIISNDLEYYAYIINHAILNGCDFSVTDEISFWNAVEQQSASLQAKVCTAVTTENKFFIDTVDYKQYQLFCEKTPSVFVPQSDDPRLKEILDLVDQVTPGKAPTVETPCLFLTYYANAYFGIAQCCQIDAIRSIIGQIEDERTRYVLLTMLMSVMSASASTTTHFAQYLKVKSKATCNNLIGKRKINIIESCKSLLAEYRQAGLCTADRKAPSVCYNLDFSDCLDSISLNNETLVYADPPYFKEHYSRYYHVLNTVCLYDYPAMAMNPQTHELSIGRYREDRSVSDFGKKAKALGAFDTLITKCSNAGAWLMISYSDNSIVDISDIQALAEKKYDVLIEKVELSHSKQGRSSISKVDEYIFICRPKEIVHDVDEKLSVIKELKPIVDNPAGFMHNYMARKPYNVVSEIIKRFCPDGGCVYDPMFGSGTTIIEASKLGRKAIGTDINLLAYKLCKASLTRWNLSKVEEAIDTFCTEVSFACESLYCFEDFDENRILERCHFDQCGSELVPTMYWYKTRKNGKLTGRKKSVASCEFIENYRSFQTDCVQNIDNLPLIPNSRIAVKNGAAVFFADKAIFVEGASERLLLPDMIEKCAKAGDFDSQAYKLPAQYYTLIEIGGAYAYKFIPFVEFLGIPCLILTDLDSVLGTEGKNGRTYYKSVPVYLGETTSNETIKWWWRKSKGLSEDDKGKIPITEITSMTADEKTKGKCHLEFQTKEQGLCGHSLEEAIRNVNRAHYELEDTITEDDIEFSGKSKTDFALDLVYECDDYTIPAYIKSGLKWLNEQKILE